ncbi:MAG: hypothetical protein WC348_03260 [Patescibacteria group bacterium]|jgi:hypothetical protein
MRRSPDWKANAIILLLALGVGALYGITSGFIFWLFGCENAVEIGEIVSTAAGGLALLAALLFIAYILAPRNEFEQPLSQLERGFVWLAGISLCILIAIPFVARALGRFLCRVFGTNAPQEEKTQ